MVDTLPDKALPTAEEAFGSELPSAESAFGPAPGQQSSGIFSANDPAGQVAAQSGPFSGEYADYFSSHTDWMNRILGSFGQAASQSWGAAQPDMPEEVKEQLQKQGLDKTHQDTRQSVLKSGNEAWMRSAAYSLYHTSILPGVELGSLVAGAQAALSGVQAGTEQAAQELGRASKSLDSLGTVSGLPGVGKPVGLGYPLGMLAEGLSGVASGFLPESGGMPHLNEARAVGAIGESEGHFFGSVEPTPEQTKARLEATGQMVSQATPDIHREARKIAPYEYDTYQALSQQKDFYSDKLRAIQEPPEAQGLRDQIDSILDNVNGNEEELSDRRAQELSDARNKLQETLDQGTPEAQRIQKNISDIDKQLDEVSPAVQDAYSLASERVSPYEGDAPSVVPGEDSQTQTPVIPKTADELSQGEIAKDVESRLLKLGRPEAEAKAAGILWQQRYDTRSSRSPQLGTAEEIYNREGPEIVPGYYKKASDGKVLNQNLSKEQAFKLTADTQRDLPEHAMLKAQRVLGGGVMGHLLEHVGDLTHRIAEHNGKLGDEFVKPKVNRALVALKSEYGFEKEHQENLRSNKVSPEEEEKALLPYVEEHKKVPVFNRVQELGRNAAIHLAEKQYSQSIKDLEELKEIIDSGKFKEENSKFDPNYESKEYGQKSKDRARGSLTLGTPKNILRIFETADSSTFFHETGHQWLEELMKDAAHPDAHPDLVADAKATRDWLKNDGGPLTRAQHEKFARGFERYLREGRAPSKELQGIFSKFKTWLTSIYKTLSQLPNAKLSDDVRGVMDRLLVPGEDRGVVAPDPRAASIQDFIKSVKDRAASRETPVEESEALAQKKGALEAEERQKSIEHFIKMVKNRAIEKNSDSARGEHGASKDMSGLDKPEEPVKGGKTSITDKGTFKTESTEYINKAGNINIDKLNSDHDLDQTIKDFYEQNKADLDLARGQISPQDLLDLMQSGGVSKHAMKMDALTRMADDGGIPMSAVVRGLRKVYRDSATSIKEISEGDDLVAFAEARQRHLMLTKRLMGVTAEAGRTLRAFRTLGEEARKEQKLSEFFQSTLGKTDEQVRRELRQTSLLETPEQVSNFVAKTDKASLGDMALEMFRNALISGPITHMTYAVGNKIYALYKAVPETLARAAVGAVHEAVVGHPIERVYFGEALEGSAAITFGQWDGLKSAVKSFKAGQTLSLPGEGSVGDLAIKRALKEKNLEWGSQAFKDRVSEFKLRIAQEVAEKENLSSQDFIDRVEELQKSPEVVDEGASTPFTKTHAIPGIAGTILRSPGERLVAPIHSWDRTIGYNINLTQMIYRKARSEGLEGDALSRRIAELTNDVPDDISFKARQEATEQALMGRTGDFTRRFKTLAEWDPNLPILGRTKPLQFAVPFVSVYANIAKAAILERTPVGMLAPSFWRDATGKNGAFAQDTAIAKMGLGTALAGATAAGLMTGLFQGPPPEDRNRAKIEQQTKGLPNSVRIGEMSYELGRLGVPGKMLSIYLALASAFKVGHDHLSKDPEFLPAFKAASLAAFSSVKEDFMAEGPLAGLGDLLKASEDSGRYGPSYLQNFLSSAVPFSVGASQIAKQVDPMSREAHGLIQSIKAKVPYLSEELEEKVDLLGNPVPNKEYYGVYAKHLDDNPIYKAMEGTGYFPAPVKRDINGVKLTDEQYHSYAIKAGMLAEQLLTPMVTSPGWENLPFSVKHDYIKNTFETSRKSAQDYVKGEHPDIIDKSNQMKTDALTATGPKE